MAILVAGLILFIGVHSLRMVAAPWRAAQIERLGVSGWRAMFAVLSLAGIGLVAWTTFAFWLHGALIGVRPLG